jgi:hypothetical protein
MQQHPLNHDQQRLNTFLPFYFYPFFKVILFNQLGCLQVARPKGKTTSFHVFSEDSKRSFSILRLMLGDRNIITKSF